MKFLKKLKKKSSDPETENSAQERSQSNEEQKEQSMDNEKASVENGAEPKAAPDGVRVTVTEESGEIQDQEAEEIRGADEGAGAAALNEEQIHELLEQSNQARREADEYKDKYMRLLADFENFKKRTLKERSDLLKYQGEKVFQDILETVDNLELALSYSSSDYEKMKAGIELIYKKFLDTLGRWEVRGQSSIGKEFDPNVHNAISRVPVDDAKPGTIINELKRTFFYKDKLLRVGEVVVADARPAQGDGQEPKS